MALSKEGDEILHEECSVGADLTPHRERGPGRCFGMGDIVCLFEMEACRLPSGSPAHP
jgi:hypothetical protein